MPSLRKANRDIYYKEGVLSGYTYLSVIARFSSNNIGTIVTAHPADYLRQPGTGGYKYVSK